MPGGPKGEKTLRSRQPARRLSRADPTGEIEDKVTDEGNKSAAMACTARANCLKFSFCRAGYGCGVSSITTSRNS